MPFSDDAVAAAANEHVFGGGPMLMGRSVSSQRLARVWMVFFLARGEETRGVSSLEEASSGSSAC